MKYQAFEVSLVFDDQERTLSLHCEDNRNRNKRWDGTPIPYEHIDRVETKNGFWVGKQASIYLRRPRVVPESGPLQSDYHIKILFSQSESMDHEWTGFVEHANRIAAQHRNDQPRVWFPVSSRTPVDEKAEDRRKGQYSKFGGLVLGEKYIHYEGKSFPITGARATVDTGAAAQSRVSLTRVTAGAFFGPAGVIVGALAKKNTGQIFLNIETANGAYLVAVGPASEAKLAGKLVSRINSHRA